MRNNDTISPAQFDEVFIDDIPMLDVRAPIEFDKGAFPEAVNLPILNDHERHQIGIRYKAAGDEAARRLGLQLLGPEGIDARISAWHEYLKTKSEAVLYCFRGGDRSRVACDWLAKTGVVVPRVLGGYKALRKHLLDVYETLPQLILISGKTGCGKTSFLNHFTNAIDLEGIANHRGSAFGGHLSPQPSQVDFENAAAISFLKLRRKPEILLEDEGRLIGRISIPVSLQNRMKVAPLLVIEEPLDCRADRIFQEYIMLQWKQYDVYFKKHPDLYFRDYLLNALDAIKKRLGGVAHREIRRQMLDACQHHDLTDSLELHRRWIKTLLVDYYDPMYEYQIGKKSDRIKAKDSHVGLIEWYKNAQANR